MTAPEKISALWFLPTFGDGRYLGAPEFGARRGFRLSQADRARLRRLGFEGVLIPTGRACEDSWLLASALAPFTEKLKFLVAVRPGVLSPTQAARMTATLDRISNGRVLINVVSGGDPQENRGDGLFWDHAERYRAAEEFLGVYKRILAGETVTFTGDYIKVEDARVAFPPVQRPHPPLYFGGSSEHAHEVGARTIDKYLSWGEPPQAVAAKFDGFQRPRRKGGRKVTLGVRLHLIVRETNEAAWAAANRLIEKLDDSTIAKAQDVFARMDSVGQSRMSALHGGRRDKLEVAPNFWAGVGLVRGGAGTALVGDPDTVAERIDEYRRIGADTFIFSGYPHLEEAYRVAELLLPRLPLKHALGAAKSSSTQDRSARSWRVRGPETASLRRAAAASSKASCLNPETRMSIARPRPTAFSRFDARPAGPALGAEILGLDLSRPLSSEVAARSGDRARPLRRAGFSRPAPQPRAASRLRQGPRPH